SSGVPSSRIAAVATRTTTGEACCAAALPVPTPAVRTARTAARRRRRADLLRWQPDRATAAPFRPGRTAVPRRRTGISIGARDGTGIGSVDDQGHLGGRAERDRPAIQAADRRHERRIVALDLDAEQLELIGMAGEAGGQVVVRPAVLHAFV